MPAILSVPVKSTTVDGTQGTIDPSLLQVPNNQETTGGRYSPFSGLTYSPAPSTTSTTTSSQLKFLSAASSNDGADYNATPQNFHSPSLPAADVTDELFVSHDADHYSHGDAQPHRGDHAILYNGVAPSHHHGQINDTKLFSEYQIESLDGAHIWTSLPPDPQDMYRDFARSVDQNAHVAAEVEQQPLTSNHGRGRPMTRSERNDKRIKEDFFCIICGIFIRLNTNVKNHCVGKHKTLLKKLKCQVTDCAGYICIPLSGTPLRAAVPPPKRGTKLDEIQIWESEWRCSAVPKKRHYICPICRDTFSTPRMLADHMARVHPGM